MDDGFHKFSSFPTVQHLFLGLNHIIAAKSSSILASIQNPRHFSHGFRGSVPPGTSWRGTDACGAGIRPGGRGRILRLRHPNGSKSSSCLASKSFCDDETFAKTDENRVSWCIMYLKSWILYGCFHKWGYPQHNHPFKIGIFQYKPSSYWATPISGNLRIVYDIHM